MNQEVLAKRLPNLSCDLASLQVVLGVDVAYRRSGWAVMKVENSDIQLVASGFILSHGISRGERLVSIDIDFEAVMGRYQPRLVVIERPGKWMNRVGSSRDSIELQAMARGLMLRRCAQLAVPALEIDFYEARRKVLGQGNAGKADVARALQGWGFQLPVNRVGRVDDDIADSILLAIVGVVG